MTTVIRGPSASGTIAPAPQPSSRTAATRGFAPMMAQARTAQDAATRVTVRPGDTLVGLVQGYLARTGQPVDERQALRHAHEVASANRMANPHLIRPGDSIDMAVLSHRTRSADIPGAATALRAAAATRASAVDARPVATSAAPSTRAALASRLQPSPASASNPVLEHTLKRAVDKGYLPASDLPAVRVRITEMARNYNFAPDDFARVALMESDGLNPRATNGNCHGIIQFCEGSGRGAASVDLAGRARTILDMSVLRQLDLAERYFQDVGLRPNGQRHGLDDLYLSVLTPAARVHRAADAPLPVAGPQAAALHLNGDQSGPITRASITHGLIRNAAERLSRYLAPTSGTGNTVPADRQDVSAAPGERWPLRTAFLARSDPDDGVASVE
jgi:hypothetical protein